MTEFPNPAFYFKVEYGKLELSFQEISGIPMEDSDSKKSSFHPSVKCRKGFCRNSTSFQLISNALMVFGKIPSKTLTISLLNSDKEVVRAWQFMNAYPTKLDIEPFEKTSEYFLIENLEFQYTMVTRTL